MKIIVVSDFHADMYNQYAQPVTGKPWNTRFQSQLDSLDKIFDMAEKEKALVVFNGDLFNSRININQVVYTQIVNKIAERSFKLNKETGYGVFMLAGNHDQYDNSRVPNNSLSVFNNIKDSKGENIIDVFSYPDHFLFNDIEIFMLPYSEDVDYMHESLDEMLCEAEPNTKRYLFAHIGVAGAVQGKWNHRLSGAFKLSELHTDMFEQIILGHYHKRQTLTTDKNHLVYYVGNTVPLNHNDDGDKKGVYLIDTEDNSARFIPLDNPIFDTVYINSKEDIDKVDSTNKFLRVIIKDKTLLEDECLKDKNIVISYVPEEKDSSRLGIDAKSSTSDIVSKYTNKYYPKATKDALNVLNDVLSGKDE